ncbi:MAG: MoaD/ThiS family protein [Sedimenticolaceae bacterium]|jgi:sulfur-carrier protein
MQVQLELYASLMKHLPSDAKRHRVTAEVTPGTTAYALLDRYGVPFEHAHLVLRNGVFLHQQEREQTPLEEGDVIAVWPPVAGG